MNELKTLQEEDKEFFESHEGKLWSKAIELAFKAPFVEVAMMHILKRVSEKYFTLGLMKGVELVEGVVEKEASAKHDNHEDWQDGDCDCDGVFDYWEIRRLTDKLKQELK